MFEENTPVVGQGLVYRMHAVPIAVQRPPRMYLAGKVPAVGDPHRQRFGAENLSNLDAVNIVFDRLPPHGRIGMRETAKFIRKFPSRLILERSGVHRIEMQSTFERESAQLA